MLWRGEYSRPPRSCCGCPRPAQLLRLRSFDRQMACDHDLADIARASRADEFIFKVVGDLFDGAFGGSAEAAAAWHFHDQTIACGTELRPFRFQLRPRRQPDRPGGAIHAAARAARRIVGSLETGKKRERSIF